MERLHNKILQNNILQIDMDKSAQKYYGLDIRLHNIKIKSRISKITPTKTGQFVTFWKRSIAGTITPYDDKDPFDLLVVNLAQQNKIGQFVFPKSALVEKNIISSGNNIGKNAFRVYSPWEQNLNKQAKDTQLWQSNYFIEISDTASLDIKKLHSLYQIS